MDLDFLELAQRVREMMLRARTGVARAQLRRWAEEFEKRAAMMKPKMDVEPPPKCQTIALEAGDRPDPQKTTKAT
jgi:hypothetical protein